MVVVEQRPAPRRTPARARVVAVRRVAAILAVVAATLAGGYLGLVAYDQERELSVGTIRLSVSPGHRGALDLYVPLVDWGARFEAIRLPARLRIDLRTVDRTVVTRIADGGTFDVRDVRADARDAIAGYLRWLVGIVFLCAVALGALVALAIRSRHGPPLKLSLATAAATALAGAVLIALLLPPRGPLGEPQYYAYGPDIPRALEAVEAVQRSGAALDEEVDAQLVGLARLVTAPGQRVPLSGRPSLTVASDLHNNVLALPILERTARRGPVLFAGDLTDRGSPLESELTRRIVRTGRPFVFVSGNHDSDALSIRLAAEGAVVLTQEGRLRADGTYGDVVVDVDGLRVAGYSDPYERRSSEDFADRYEPRPSTDEQEAFSRWLTPLVGTVDVVLVHEPALIEPALRELAAEPPRRPLVLVVGHTHDSELRRSGTLTVLNAGSLGAGGTGNLAESSEIGIARLIYDAEPAFSPLAADLISIDPGTGDATARRTRLDEGQP